MNIEEAAAKAYKANQPVLVEQEQGLMLYSIAISLKRIADQLEKVDADGFRNQLLDIAYQAGVNFRGS